MSENVLPGIFKIEYLPASEMTLYPKKVITPGGTKSVIGNFSKLNTIDLASCIVTPERISAGTQYSTKIAGRVFDDGTGNTKLQDQLMNLYHLYRITDISKNQYLIGTDKKPFPEIVFMPAIESSETGLRHVPFEITWISTLPPIELIAL